MSASVLAIALDACSPVLLESWLARGRLPNLAAARERGAYGWLRNSPLQPYENSWGAFLHGASPTTTGQWGHNHFDPATYSAREEPCYEFDAYPPFYAMSPERRVAVFDLNLASPATGVNGIQVLGWGTEDNQALRVSQPPELMAELLARHGDCAIFADRTFTPSQQAGAAGTVSYRTPNVYDRAALQKLRKRLVQGVAQRTRIIQDLLGRERWDLFVGSYSEPHLAGHLLWHLGQRHPLGNDGADTSEDDDAILEVVERIDDAIGGLLQTLPDDAHLVLFSVFGMKPNALDLLTTVFLPEFLFRWHWDEAALAPGPPAHRCPPLARNDVGHWKDAMWSLRTPLGDSLLESPRQQEARGDPLDWNPLNWYRPLWRQMRAFALPSYSHGMVRLNVRGRESQGIVEPADYARECEQLTAALLENVDARRGHPIVREVVRTRSDPMDPDPLKGPADLVVRWNEAAPVDCVDSPRGGRIGPVPYFRTGGHAANGFCLALGPGVPSGSELGKDASVCDLSASLLTMMGERVPGYMEGKPLWDVPGRRHRPVSMPGAERAKSSG